MWISRELVIDKVPNKQTKRQTNRQNNIHRDKQHYSVICITKHARRRDSVYIYSSV